MPDLQRVLIIDDNQLDAQLLREAFGECGFTPAVVWAPMGALGMEFLSRFGDTDDQLLVVLDLNMPGVSGHEVLRQIRASARHRHARVLVFTTSTLPADRAACDALGVCGFIRKPTSFEEYRAVVDRIRELLGEKPEPVALVGDEG